MNGRRVLALVAAGGVATTATLSVSRAAGPEPRDTTLTSAASTVLAVSRSDLSKIKHVIVIMQENRSFDSYFGTYPGADGLPRSGGRFTTCNPDLLLHGCRHPYHNPADANSGGGHTHQDALTAIDGGRMDGFVNAAQYGFPNVTDVMGYHDAREIPNYWQYAHQYVLQDRMFSSASSWSLPEHLYMVSGWSATCVGANPATCQNDIESVRGGPQPNVPGPTPTYAWTDLTYMLHKHGVSWRYYVEGGTEPDCRNAQATCGPVPQNARTPTVMNPLPWFTTVQEDGEVANVTDVSNFFTAAKAGTLPAVSWITPSGPDSEHPPSSVHQGQRWTTNLINAVMQSPNWDSSAIFLSWDDWGGFYDHVRPPTADANGYGMRVPGLLISPYARQGYVDHQVLSHDAYNKFIEDVFLGGARIDPATDQRPDPRPTVRESLPLLGDLASAFDFTQPPQPPLVLPPDPPPGPQSVPDPPLEYPPAPPPAGQGLWLVADDGGLFPEGQATSHSYGSTGNVRLNQPVITMAPTPTGNGYWLVAADGGIFPFGDARFHSYGSMGNIRLNQPIVGMAPTRTGNGYWLVAADGGIFPFGDARFHSYGSTGNIRLNKPIIGMLPTPSGNGYWLVASDGGLFPFGDARFHSYGSLGAVHLVSPIVGATATRTGNGYWLVAGDGGIFPFGDARFSNYGSAAPMHLRRPVIGMARTPSGHGYWIVAADGTTIPFGDADPLQGPRGPLNRPVVGLAALPDTVPLTGSSVWAP